MAKCTKPRNTPLTRPPARSIPARWCRTPGTTPRATSSSRSPPARRSSPRRPTTAWAGRLPSTWATDTGEDDLIFQETQTAYDAAGNTLLTTTYQRLPGASDSETGPLDQLSTYARVTYTAAWQDGLGRQIVTADYGTNNGTAMTLSTRPAAVPVWSGGTWTGTGAENGAIVSGTAYDAAGRPWQTTDPNGIVSQTLYDAAGRTVETIQNYVDGDPATGTPDQDVTTETTYTPDGQVATYTAVDATANTSGPNTLTPEVTTYVYGSDLGAAGEGFIPLVHDNDLLRAVIYPDSQNTPADVAAGSAGTGGYNRVEYQYDRQGEEVQTEDQNQTVHDYIFDQLGRQTEDEVTQFGTGIDDSIDAIVQGYDLLGNVNDVKSMNGETVKNEVFRQYNDWGQLAAEYQANDGPVDTDSTPVVRYAYADGSANTVRLTSMTYPNGRVLTYGYNAGDDDALGRVSCLADSDSTVLASYAYLGLGQITGVSNPEPGISTGVTLDQFGRVASVAAGTTGGNLVDLNYGHDADGNVTYRQDAEAEQYTAGANLDEIYQYNGLNELTATERGQWDNGNPQTGTFVADTGGLSQSWTLDATGNWSSVTTDGTAQNRTANAANQITSISNAVTPVYDNAGNMTLVPSPSGGGQGEGCVFDAWNRLVKVTTGSGETETTVAEYGYDGLGRRVIKKTYDSAGDLSEVRHFFLSDQDQVLQEDIEASPIPNPQSLIPVCQYVWGLRYVDDLVLRDDNSTGGDLGITGSGLGRRLYAIQDANWNVVAVADTSGAVVERYTYTAYGQVEVRNPDFSSATNNQSAFAWTVLYTGRDLDMETGLQYNRARYYDPALGTFVSTDPLGYKAGDFNLYRYCRNNSVIYVDPSGRNVYVIERPLALASNDLVQMQEVIATGAAELMADIPFVGWIFAGATEYASWVFGYYRDNTYHAMLVVAPQCQPVVANGHVTGFGVQGVQTWDFQAASRTAPGGGGWQHPALDFNPQVNPQFPSGYYPAGGTRVITIVNNNTFDKAVTNAANANRPVAAQYRAGGNQRRYNCVDWVVQVLAAAGLGGRYSNHNPEPFGDDANVPWWVPSSAIGWLWDRL